MVTNRLRAPALISLFVEFNKLPPAEKPRFGNKLNILKKQLTSLGLKENEFNLRSIKVDDNGTDDDYQTIIEIVKGTSND